MEDDVLFAGLVAELRDVLSGVGAGLGAAVGRAPALVGLAACFGFAVEAGRAPEPVGAVGFLAAGVGLGACLRGAGVGVALSTAPFTGSLRDLPLRLSFIVVKLIKSL